MSLTYLEAIRQAQHALRDDPRVFINGQDVGFFGGAFKATKNLADSPPLQCSRSAWASAPPRPSSRWSMRCSCVPCPIPIRIVWSISRRTGAVPGDVIFSYTEDYAAWKNHNRTLSHLRATCAFRPTSLGQGEAERITGAYSTMSLFPLLGVQPVMGRTFRPRRRPPRRPAGCHPESRFLEAPFRWRPLGDWQGTDSGPPPKIVWSATLAPSTNLLMTGVVAAMSTARTIRCHWPAVMLPSYCPLMPMPPMPGALDRRKHPRRSSDRFESPGSHCSHHPGSSRETECRKSGSTGSLKCRRHWEQSRGTWRNRRRNCRGDFVSGVFHHLGRRPRCPESRTSWWCRTGLARHRGVAILEILTYGGAHALLEIPLTGHTCVLGATDVEGWLHDVHAANPLRKSTRPHRPKERAARCPGHP